MKRPILILAGVAVSCVSTADIGRYQPQPDQRHPIERPMPPIPQPGPAPWVVAAEATTPNSVRVIGRKGDNTVQLHVGPGNSASASFETSHNVLGK